MTDGIKGTGETKPTQGIQPLSGPDTDEGKFAKAMDTPIRTLGDLKKVLIDNLGEKKGKKLYNHFIQSMVEAMLSQIRQTSQSASQATKSMGQTR